MKMVIVTRKDNRPARLLIDHDRDNPARIFMAAPPMISMPLEEAKALHRALGEVIAGDTA